MTTPHRADLKLPENADLAVLYAEPISFDLDAPYWGWTPLPWDIMDERLTFGGDVSDVMEEIVRKVMGGTKLVFFFPRRFQLWGYIDAISDDPEEVSTLSRFDVSRGHAGPRHKIADVLLVRDLPTLRRLARRAELLRLLLDATAGQADDESWCIFLGHPSLRADWLFPSKVVGDKNG